MIRPNFVPPPTYSLAGRDGELVLIRITVEPRLLESLLESLAGTSYHINPEVFPNSPQGARVEFPAYESWVEPIRDGLRSNGLDPASLESIRMLARLAS